jgi:hypothetical protein
MKQPTTIDELLKLNPHIDRTTIEEVAKLLKAARVAGGRRTTYSIRMRSTSPSVVIDYSETERVRK